MAAGGTLGSHGSYIEPRDQITDPGAAHHEPAIDTRDYPYRWRVGLAIVGAIAIWITLAVLVDGHDHAIKGPFLSFSHTVSGACLLAAAAICFTYWRSTGLVRSAWCVIAFSLVGLAIPTVSLITRSGAIDGRLAYATVARDLVDICLLGICLAALTSPPVRPRFRPVRILAPILVGYVAIATVLMVAEYTATWVEPITAFGPYLSHAVWIGWVATGITFAVRAALTRDWRYARYTLAMLVPGTMAGARAFDGPMSYSGMTIPSGIEFAGCTAILGGACVMLWRLQAGRSATLLHVSGQLREVSDTLNRAEQDEARRLHDARTAILAVSGAVHVLSKRVPRADRDEAVRLRHLVAAELDRLAALLDPAVRRSNHAISPREVVEPLVMAHRFEGHEIHADLADCAAFGRSELLASAVANILGNAAVHASGATVWVTVEPVGADVHIRISDDGPGIPELERSVVLIPGISGDGSGSGLGIPSAATAMSDQGGTLRISERPGGGTMITLTLRRMVTHRDITTSPTHDDEIQIAPKVVR